jgi:hypothetical protein
MLRRPYQIALVIIAVFSVYYMSIFAELCAVDDSSVMLEFFNAKDTSFMQIFMPRVVEGGYYRPLIPLSYLINLRIWDLNNSMLHMENVLLHVANAILVFFLTLYLLPKVNRDKSYIPIFAAIIFGLHPITTESVNWISGRTDIIAGFFVLISSLFVVRFKRTGSKGALFGAVLSVLMGLLGKEAALGFIPGAFFLFAASDKTDSPILDKILRFTFKQTLFLILLIGSTIMIELLFFNFLILFVTIPLFASLLYYRHKDKNEHGTFISDITSHMAGIIITLFVAIGLFIATRQMVFVSSIARIPQTIKLMGQDINYTLSIFLESTGFYLKKFFIPIPLNFAIREVDPLYAILGTIIVFIGIMFVTSRSVPTALALTGFFMFTPALPLAFGKIAWTAYAERYIYISAAFWSVAMVIWLNSRIKTFEKHLNLFFITLIIVLAGVTIGRNLTWQTNMGLIRDTVSKSPYFLGTRIMYMGLLIDSGKYKEAREQFVVASSLPMFPYDERLDSNMAVLLLKEEKNDEALRIYEKILEKTKGGSSNARGQIINILKNKIQKEKDPELLKNLVLKLGNINKANTPIKNLNKPSSKS